jgi:hypothetical protein
MIHGLRLLTGDVIFRNYPRMLRYWRTTKSSHALRSDIMTSLGVDFLSPYLRPSTFSSTMTTNPVKCSFCNGLGRWKICHWHCPIRGKSFYRWEQCPHCHGQTPYNPNPTFSAYPLIHPAYAK